MVSKVFLKYLWYVCTIHKNDVLFMHLYVKSCKCPALAKSHQLSHLSHLYMCLYLGVICPPVVHYMAVTCPLSMLPVHQVCYLSSRCVTCPPSVLTVDQVCTIRASSWVLPVHQVCCLFSRCVTCPPGVLSVHQECYLSTRSVTSPPGVLPVHQVGTIRVSTCMLPVHQVCNLSTRCVTCPPGVLLVHQVCYLSTRCVTCPGVQDLYLGVYLSIRCALSGSLPRCYLSTRCVLSGPLHVHQVCTIRASTWVSLWFSEKLLLIMSVTLSASTLSRLRIMV